MLIIRFEKQQLLEQNIAIKKRAIAFKSEVAFAHAVQGWREVAWAAVRWCM
jgi:hypothetical protein